MFSKDFGPGTFKNLFPDYIISRQPCRIFLIQNFSLIRSSLSELCTITCIANAQLICMLKISTGSVPSQPSASSNHRPQNMQKAPKKLHADLVQPYRAELSTLLILELEPVLDENIIGPIIDQTIVSSIQIHRSLQLSFRISYFL